MNTRHAPIQMTPADTTSLRGSLHGRWLTFVRAAWLVLAVSVLGLDILGLPYAFERYQSMCTQVVCGETSGGLSPESAQALNEAGLSAGSYAAYLVALQVATTLIFAGVAAVIFWRRSGDQMALFAAFTLLVFGGSTISSDIPDALAAAHPAFQFPVNFLDYLGEVAFGVFFYLFPNGSFVPRWASWLALAFALLFVPFVFFSGSALDLLDGPLFLTFPASLVRAGLPLP